MATPTTHAVVPKTPNEREELVPAPSSARPVVPVNDTLPPPEDVERHDTIPAPTWFGDAYDAKI